MLILACYCYIMCLLLANICIVEHYILCCVCNEKSNDKNFSGRGFVACSGLFSTNSYRSDCRWTDTRQVSQTPIPTFLDLSSSFIWRRDLKKVSQKVSCNDFGEAICQTSALQKLILSLLQTKLHKTQHPNHQP